MVKHIYDHFLKSELGEDFTSKDILEYMDNHPEVKNINAKFTRNEGLIKSIKEDQIIDIKNLK